MLHTTLQAGRRNAVKGRLDIGGHNVELPTMLPLQVNLPESLRGADDFFTRSPRLEPENEQFLLTAAGMLLNPLTGYV